MPLTFRIVHADPCAGRTLQVEQIHPATGESLGAPGDDERPIGPGAEIELWLDDEMTLRFTESDLGAADEE